eukprot:6208272-Pleurochrysis_carterae.AAC.2
MIVLRPLLYRALPPSGAYFLKNQASSRPDFSSNCSKLPTVNGNACFVLLLATPCATNVASKEEESKYLGCIAIGTHVSDF